jgi:antitoxin VapB
MSIFVKDAATDRAIRKLAKLKGTTLTEAIRQAVEKELKAAQLKTRHERLDALLTRLDKLPRSGLKADKAFYDELSGDI